MLGIGVMALNATKRLTDRRNAWIDVVTGEHAPPKRQCDCEACIAYFEIIDRFSESEEAKP